MSKVLPAGTVAPGFTLRVTLDQNPPDQNLSLSDLAGTPVIRAFSPADWSPVCCDQIEDFVAAIEQHLHAKAAL